MKHHILFFAKLLTLAGGYLFTRAHTRSIKYRARENSLPNVAVLLLLQHVKRVVLHHARLLRDVEFHVDMLENDVRLLKAFLKDASGKRVKDGAVLGFLGEVESVVCEAERVVGAYVVWKRKDGERGFLQRAVFGGVVEMVGVAKGVQKMRGKVKGVFGRSRVVFATTRREEEVVKEEERKKVFLVSQDHVLDLESKPKSAICDPPEKSDDLGIITVIRMPDLRKASLGGIAVQDWSKNNPLAIGFLFANNRSEAALCYM